VAVDVVVPIYRDVALTLACAQSVLDHSGPSLERLILINDASPEVEMVDALRAMRNRDGRVRVLTNERNRGFIWTANVGLSVGEQDVVLLNSDTKVTPGWLDGLNASLYSHSDLAVVSPLSNNASFCSVPKFMEGVPVAELEGKAVDLSGLPIVTFMPTAHGFCLAFRREALNRLGLFDLAYGRGYNEENDWCQRARTKRWRVGRANRVMVFHHGEVSFAGERARLDVLNLRRLLARYPRYLNDTRAFEASSEARVAAEVVSRQLQGAEPSLR
jgi:GT2 family glycosyltransferase